jgi:hypothetical protein
MSQERTFTLTLKNDQTIVLKFNSIVATGDRLWQMFATTEALDAVDQLVTQDVVAETRSARKTAPEKPASDAVKPAVPKKKK